MTTEQDWKQKYDELGQALTVWGDEFRKGLNEANVTINTLMKESLLKDKALRECMIERDAAMAAVTELATTKEKLKSAELVIQLCAKAGCEHAKTHVDLQHMLSKLIPNR